MAVALLITIVVMIACVGFFIMHVRDLSNNGKEDSTHVDKDLEDALKELGDAMDEFEEGIEEIRNVTPSQAYTFADYEVFIEDAVRYILVEAHPNSFFESYNSELSSKTRSKINKIADKIESFDKPRYKMALGQVSEESSGYEKKYATWLLDIYNNLNIDIVSIQEDNKHEYHFIEKNSRVNFTANIGFFSYVSPDTWDMERYIEYLETGIFPAAPNNEQEEANDESYLMKVYEDENIDPVVKPIYIRIYNQYSGKYTDNQIMSKAFYSTFNKAQQLNDSEMGWPDWDYWEQTQGAYAKLNSVSVDLISSTSAMAHITLFYPENGDYTTVDMPMVYEENGWYVDDIISYENDEPFSLKQAAINLQKK